MLISSPHRVSQETQPFFPKNFITGRVSDAGRDTTTRVSLQWFKKNRAASN